PAHGNSTGGVVTLWIDPEVGLIPRLLRTRGSIAEATTYFVRRSADSATVLAATPAGQILPRRRVATKDLAPLIARPAADSELIIGAGPDGVRSMAGHAYIPRLRWQVYRALPEAKAYAPFRRQTTTEGVLAFLLGSFVIGVLVWTVRGQREQAVRAELLQARVDSLQAQLRPHFLFNALNTIATLVHEDADRADAMLLRLADLLRLSLEHSDRAELPLRNELEILDAYIAVERVRFGTNLAVTKDIAPEALDVLVPRWILQPLAENAIKHGAAYTRGAARIDLSARVTDGMLEVAVGDDGPHPPGPTVREGVGLRNTRTRLETLYGHVASLALHRREQGGTEAVLRIPVAPDLSIEVLTTRTGELPVTPHGQRLSRA
ncbi:MAG TPA: histidine kinase, partial [Gemmatimonadaceae bacterium]|nr:histidine kinase [Gemmatimonadaceae bacterium]